MQKILGVCWFSGRVQIGVVLTSNDIGEEKAYIGCCTSSGISEMVDAKHIAEYGSKFPLEEAKILIKKEGSVIN